MRIRISVSGPPGIGKGIVCEHIATLLNTLDYSDIRFDKEYCVSAKVPKEQEIKTSNL